MGYSPTYFSGICLIKYIMPKIKFNALKAIKKILPFIICVSVLISVPCLTAIHGREEGPTNNDPLVLTVWQIDSFEGGRGSRAAYLQNIADEFSAKEECFLRVSSLSSSSARLNLANGNMPDLISYGAGIHGVEGFLRGKKPYQTWCNGGYCILTLEENADFSDVSPDNTVVNSGTENLIGATAVFCGLDKADFEKPTGAYVQLINGKYKYLLGTQRDIFRLKTRGMTFSVKPVTQFNDLYQNISVTTTDSRRKNVAEKFIDYLLTKSDKLSKLGLMIGGKNLYDDEMSQMEGLSYDYKLISPVNESTKKELISAIANCDENKLKILLK